jgi:hypothetical protein
MRSRTYPNHSAPLVSWPEYWLIKQNRDAARNRRIALLDTLTPSWQLVAFLGLVAGLVGVACWLV